MAEGIPTLRKARYAIEKGTLIGEGSYRKVYRTRRGKWVYKVNIGGKGVGSNRWEWNTYQDYHDNLNLPENVRIPQMHYLPNGIIAAEYVNGKEPNNDCYRDYHVSSCPGVDVCWAEKVKNVPISDIHYQNVLITDGGLIYIIDLGHGLS
jgi:hypothetical protein